MEKLGWFLLVTVASWFGGFIGSYFRKKGENLATKEDFRELKVQTTELRQTTKEIEAKIESQVWDRQRHWELKRDAVLAVIQALSAAEDALMKVCVFYQMLMKDPTSPNKTGHEQALLEWKEKMTEFESKRIVAKLMCSEEFNTSLTAVRNAIRMGIMKMSQKSIKSYDEIGPAVSPAMQGAVVAARGELGLPQDVTPQSTGSPATHAL